MKNNKTETFYRSIIGLKVEKSKALANLVMALGSNAVASSVTGLSLSPVYHYQYSRICATIDGLYSSSSESCAERSKLEAKLLALKSAYFPEPFDGQFHLLNTDSTPVLSPLLYGVVSPAWNLPLSSRRLKTDEVRGTATAQ